MENQNFATKTMLKYGVIIGILTIIVSLLNYTFGNIYKPHWGINVVNILLMIAFIVYGIKEFKTLNNGFLSLGQSIKMGLGISLIASIIGVLYLFLFIYVIEPNFMTNLEEFQQQVMYEKFPDMPEEQLEQALAMSKKFTTPTMMAMLSIVGSLFSGLIISLIAGLIMKKEEDQF